MLLSSPCKLSSTCSLLLCVMFSFPRLTNAGPFIEDENQRDIRARILDRKIDWNTLFNRNLSEEGL